MVAQKGNTRHDLKILGEYFEPTFFGFKTFEVRSTADRTFAVGDVVVLHECCSDGTLTGRFLVREITYLTDFHQKTGYVVFAHQPHIFSMGDEE